MLLSLANVWLGRLYAIFNWTLSDALGGLGRYERLLSSKLQNSRGFFLKIRFAEREVAMRYFRAKREKNFLLLLLYFSPLSEISLSVFTLIPDLPFDVRARVDS